MSALHKRKQDFPGPENESLGLCRPAARKFNCHRAVAVLDAGVCKYELVSLIVGFQGDKAVRTAFRAATVMPDPLK